MAESQRQVEEVLVQVQSSDNYVHPRCLIRAFVFLNPFMWNFLLQTLWTVPFLIEGVSN